MLVICELRGAAGVCSGLEWWESRAELGGKYSPRGGIQGIEGCRCPGTQSNDWRQVSGWKTRRVWRIWEQGTKSSTLVGAQNWLLPSGQQGEPVGDGPMSSLELCELLYLPLSCCTLMQEPSLLTSGSNLWSSLVP